MKEYDCWFQEHKGPPCLKAGSLTRLFSTGDRISINNVMMSWRPLAGMTFVGIRQQYRNVLRNYTLTYTFITRPAMYYEFSKP
jgi:hypothetical protein